MKLSPFEPQSFQPRGIRLGVVRGISYGLFGPPGEFVPQARALGAGLVRAYLYWSQVEPEPGQYRWDTVDALLGQLTGDEELWITLCSSSPWGTRQPTDFLPPSPALDQRAYAEFVRQVVRHCVDRLGRPGPVLAVRQRAEQHRPALGGHRGRVRRAAADHVPRGQGGRPGRGGRARRLRLRRVQQRAGQRAAAVLRPRGQGRPRRVRPVQRAPVRRPGPHPRVPGHRQAVHAGARVPQARRGGRARRPAAVRVSRRDGGHAGDLRRRLRRGRQRRAVAEHRRARRAGRAGHSRTPGDEGPVRPDGQPAAPAADVHGGLPGRAGGQAGPHQLPSGGHAHRAGPGRGRAPDRVLEPRARIPRARRTISR